MQIVEANRYLRSPHLGGAPAVGIHVSTDMCLSAVSSALLWLETPYERLHPPHHRDRRDAYRRGAGADRRGGLSADSRRYPPRQAAPGARAARCVPPPAHVRAARPLRYVLPAEPLG